MIALDLLVEAEGWAALGDAEALARRAVEAALAVAREAPHLGPDEEAELSLVLADDVTLRSLNAEYRQKDQPTNVLSFPAVTPPGSPTRLLGDIVLAYETVAREAGLENKSLADHAAHLIVHGVLHLLGHDHLVEAEAEAMEALEIAALARIGIANPYSDLAA